MAYHSFLVEPISCHAWNKDRTRECSLLQGGLRTGIAGSSGVTGQLDSLEGWGAARLHILGLCLNQVVAPGRHRTEEQAEVARQIDRKGDVGILGG